MTSNWNWRFVPFPRYDQSPLQNNPSFELASYPGGPPEGVEDVGSWAKAQYPPQFTLRRIGPVTYPVDLKLTASVSSEKYGEQPLQDNGNPPHVAISSIRIREKSKNQPVFSKCFISSKVGENSAKGTKVTRIPIENYEVRCRDRRKKIPLRVPD